MPDEALPDRIRDVPHLEDLLSEPTPGVVETARRLDGDVVVLGVAGKMGPTLARMLRRALDAAGKSGTRVIGVSRFSSPEVRTELDRHGIVTMTAELLDADDLERLPDAPHVVHMAGMKFGSTGNESMTWAMNTYLPGMVAQRYRRSRIVAFSTGNVYGLVPVSSGGSLESDLPNPVGEYAMSCLGRERIFEHFSRQLAIPMTLIRLNYAVEMRYGVLLDLATSVLAGRTIDLSMGHANVIWQADASAYSIQAFDHCASPPKVLNVAGPEIFRVADVARRFGELLGVEPVFQGSESPDALLNNGGQARALFGPPRVSLDKLIAWVADWVKRDGPTLAKPTHFDSRDGKF